MNQNDQVVTPPSKIGLRIEHVEQQLKKNKILHDIDFEIPEGEFVVFVGPSGCGKTTLLRLIAGLDPVHKGKIFIKDRLVNDVPPDERNIAMVFQDYALYPHMTVRGNLEFGLKNRKIPKPEIESRVKKAADILQIHEYLDRRPQHLSGGQRQRVAIGRALVRQPDLFLFDEPLSNLDAKLRGEMRIELATLQRNLGTTSVYVTHDQVEAMTLADRIVVLKSGRVQQIGTPLDIYENPANQFVASFIGSPSMNFFEGTLEKNEGVKKFRFGNFSIDLTGAPTPERSGDYVLGIRPEVIELVSAHQKTADLSAKVLTVELHGYDAHVIASAGGRQIVFRSSNEKELKALKAARKGFSLELHLNRDHLHWFESRGENRRITTVLV